MLLINRRRVDWVDVVREDGGTYTLRVKGRNDENRCYTIEVQEVKSDEPVIRLLKLCDEHDLHIATRMATLSMVLNYVSKFFAPHYASEEESPQP